MKKGPDVELIVIGCLRGIKYRTSKADNTKLPNNSIITVKTFPLRT
jgi:hypothetical protein